MSAFIYLDVNTLRQLSYILFVLTLAHFRPPSTYIYREQPKSKSDSPKKNLSLTKKTKYKKQSEASSSSYAMPYPLSFHDVSLDRLHNAGTRPQPHPGIYAQAVQSISYILSL